MSQSRIGCIRVNFYERLSTLGYRPGYRSLVLINLRYRYSRNLKEECQYCGRVFRFNLYVSAKT